MGQKYADDYDCPTHGLIILQKSLRGRTFTVKYMQGLLVRILYF